MSRGKMGAVVYDLLREFSASKGITRWEPALTRVAETTV